MLQSNTNSEIRQFYHSKIIPFEDCSSEQNHTLMQHPVRSLIYIPINELVVGSRISVNAAKKYLLLSYLCIYLLDTKTVPTASETPPGLAPEPAPPPPQAEAQYPTVWGSLTFTQLYQRTCRYAAHILRQDSRFGTNDVDDGLQVAYLKLWQRLQAEPEFLAERGIGWIGKFLFYGAVHTRQKEQRITKHRAEAATDHAGFVESLSTSKTARPHSSESRQTDNRIDLHAAIVAVANHILAHLEGIKQQRALWALYTITTLHLQVTAASKLFRVHHRAMKEAYEQVLSLLQQYLSGYQPRHETRPLRARAQQPQPYQDIVAIRQQNASIEPEYFEKVKQQLEQECPDTLDRDLIALQGIQTETTAKTQARQHNLSYSSMQRAYERVHLLLASQKDETVVPRRAQKIRAKPFDFCPEYVPLIQSVANEMLDEPNSEGKLIALYSYLCNIPNRTSARNFQMSESTVRNYRNRIQERFTTLL